MANKNYNSDFDIPLSIIFLAFVFCLPLGIILLIIRSAFGSKARNSRTANKYSAAGDTFVKARKVKGIKSKRSKSPVFFKIMSILALVFAGFTFASAISSLEFLNISIVIWLLFAVGVLVLFSLGFFLASRAFDKRESRYSRIRAIIGDRDSLNLNKLATASNTSLKKVIRDLQKMIDSGEFGESAYINLGNNNFMRTPYAQPDASDGSDVKGFSAETDRNTGRSSRNAEASEDSQTTESDNFDKIIADIKQLNYEIKDEAVSERIDRIELHTKHIFDYVTDHPEALPQIRTFMNYYLPTTLKLLESYKRIEKVGVAGENMKKSKENIENILDLLAIGFEQQVDQLFKNESIDISSDISVLETMMQKDGLSTKNDLDIKTFGKKFSDEIGGGGSAAQQAEE